MWTYHPARKDHPAEFRFNGEFKQLADGFTYSEGVAVVEALNKLVKNK